MFQVAFLFDYQSDWMWQTLPQGRDLEYFNLVYDNYRALRKLGLSIDILSTNEDFSEYKLVVAPGPPSYERGFKKESIKWVAQQ